jgi:hypothetical protein
MSHLNIVRIDWTIHVTEGNMVGTHSLGQACLMFFCCADNFCKIWSVCRQHEIQYIKCEIHKYTYNYVCTYQRIVACSTVAIQQLQGGTCVAL